MVEPVDLFDGTSGNLEKAMAIAAQRQEVIAHNIANANTPGYEALTFDEQLMQAVKRSDRKKVVLEEEMADLSDNSLKYSSYVKLLSSKMGVVRTIATQGRK